MKKRIVKALTVLALFFVIFVIAQNFSYANVKSDQITSTFGGANITNAEGKDKITSVIGVVLTVVRTVAIGISIIMITYLGIKYMSAAPSEKANIKNQLITFTIGAVIIVSATAILDIMQDFATNVTTSASS